VLRRLLRRLILTTFVADTADAPFGRNITVVASGAATSNVTVYGKDYMGQPMTESFTLNGATPVVGRKAFKWVDRITAGITAATTINVGLWLSCWTSVSYGTGSVGKWKWCRCCCWYANCS
jgi:hypothetical protein